MSTQKIIGRNGEIVSTGPATDPKEREREMLAAVDDIMEKIANGQTADPVMGDRGALVYYCRECAHIAPLTIDYDIEAEYKPVLCEQCQSPRTVISTMSGVRSHFKIKD